MTRALLAFQFFEAENDEAAREIMRNDRAVQNGVMCAELYPYQVALLTKTPEKFLRTTKETHQ